MRLLGDNETGRYAGQEEGDMPVVHPKTHFGPFYWTLIGTLAALTAAAALTVGVILFIRFDKHTAHQKIDSVCNRGENTGLGLEACPDIAGVPGYPLVSASVDNPKQVFVSRVSRGDGVLVTQTPDSHLEVSALVESLTSAIIVGVSPSPERAITLDLDLPAINVTLCDITCDANFFVNIVNGGSGYGMALGTDHTFANDATHKAAAILSGWNNALIASGGSVVVGGRYNTINDTFCSFIGAGRNNTVLGPRSGIVIGEYSLINASHSFIGSGQMNTIISSLMANAIVSGESNTITEASRSIIGAGFDCNILNSDDSGIFSGKENQIIQSVTSIIGAGADNLINNCTASGISSGRANNISISSQSFIAAGEENVIAGGVDNIIGSGTSNNITGSYDCGILTGASNLMLYSNQSFIGAGLLNTISSVDISPHNPRNAIVSGYNNTIENLVDALSGGNLFIGAGMNNLIRNQAGGDTLASVFIGSGTNNLIQSDVGYVYPTWSSVVIAGIDNILSSSSYSFLAAGDGNQIINATTSFVGVGIDNSIVGNGATLLQNAIMAGNSNTISATFTVTQNNFIGAGAANNISNVKSSTIVVGILNQIYRDASSTLDTSYNIIGAGQNNTIMTLAPASYGNGLNGILAGINNLLYNTESCTIVAGNGNIMRNTTVGFIGAGATNVMTTTFNAMYNNAIVAGGLNNMTGAVQNSFIGSGNGNILYRQSSTYGLSTCAIVAGTTNLISSSIGNAQNNFIGAGISNNISDVSGCAIIVGKSNQIHYGGTGALPASYNIIGAGQNNIIMTQAPGSYGNGNNGILAGLNNLMYNTDSCTIASGVNNIMRNTTQGFIGAGSGNVMTTTFNYMFGNAIVAGASNNMTGAVQNSFIGAGSGNVIDLLFGANPIGTVAIVAGSSNIIESTIGGATSTSNSFIGSGLSNVLRNALRCFIGAGQSNSIVNCTQCSITAGISNTITSSTTGNARAAIINGQSNTISGVATNCLIGTGQNNSILGTVSNSGIFAGTNSFIYNTATSFIGAGNNNTIDNVPTAHIGAGGNNLIRREGGSIGFADSSFIGAGGSNVILQKVGTGNDLSAFIGSGSTNSIYSGDKCAIIAGVSNGIYNGTSCFIGGGITNTISSSSSVSAQSAIVAGNNNTMLGVAIINSIIGAGINNIIERKSGGQVMAEIAIVAGNGNIIESLSTGTLQMFQNIIGSGNGNKIQSSQRCGIFVGLTNLIANMTIGFIGSGQNNQIIGIGTGSSALSAIVVGNNNSIFGGVQTSAIVAGQNNVIQLTSTGNGNTHAFIGAGTSNIIESIASVGLTMRYNFIGSGNANIIRNTQSCAIVSGISNIIQTVTGFQLAVYNLIGAGNTNLIQETGSSAIVVGISNSMYNQTLSFIGAGSSNKITTTTGVTSRNVIVAGNANTIVDCTNCFIATGETNIVNGSTDSSILTGSTNTILTANYASVIAGTGITVSGSLFASTAVTTNIAIQSTFSTSGVQTITANKNVVLGDHVFIADGVAATLSLGDSTTTPDGMQIVVRDVNDASTFPIILSCVTSGCSICPPSAACAIGGTDTMNVQYALRTYLYRASSNRWIAI